MTILTFKSSFFGGIERKMYKGVRDFIIENGELTLFVSANNGFLARLNLGDVSNFEKVYSIRDK